MKNKLTLKYGCEECGYTPEIDTEKSTKDWVVYKESFCPLCKNKLMFYIPKN